MICPKCNGTGKVGKLLLRDLENGDRFRVIDAPAFKHEVFTAITCLAFESSLTGESIYPARKAALDKDLMVIFINPDDEVERVE